jgi:hypothetical protein
MGPVDLYMAPAELDYRREVTGAPRHRRARRRLVGRRSAQPTTRPNYRVTS